MIEVLVVARCLHRLTSALDRPGMLLLRCQRLLQGDINGRQLSRKLIDLLLLYREPAGHILGASSGCPKLDGPVANPVEDIMEARIVPGCSHRFAGALERFGVLLLRRQRLLQGSINGRQLFRKLVDLLGLLRDPLLEALNLGKSPDDLVEQRDLVAVRCNVVGSLFRLLQSGRCRLASDSSLVLLLLGGFQLLLHLARLGLGTLGLLK